MLVNTKHIFLVRVLLVCTSIPTGFRRQTEVENIGMLAVCAQAS